MSHIVRGHVKTAYTDKEILVRALGYLGEVRENEKLYRVGDGFSRETYDVVLIDSENQKNRIGYNYEGDMWSQFQENYGAVGRWTKKISSKIQDRYIAFHYEKNLVEEGFKVTVQEQQDGTLELVANEGGW